MKDESMEYLPRIADDILAFKLRSKGAVWVRGPKWCGKSTTAARQAKSCIFMQDEGTRSSNIELARMAPSMFLDEEPPLLIDEWEDIPFIWNQVRFEVDRRNKFGQFILTGSKQPDQEDMDEQHTGTGRITEYVMRPMTLFESGESNGDISIEKLFSGECRDVSRCRMDLGDYAFVTARGGWPRSLGQDKDVALQQAIDYYDSVVRTEIRLADKVKKDPSRVSLLMRSYARNVGTPATHTVMKEDMSVNDSSGLDEDTIASYIKALKRIYVVEESEAWNPNLRSKTAIRTSNVRYFTDPSIGCAALGTGPKGLLKDLNTFGFLFENLCIRDLRVYSERIGGVVKHFRAANGLECDAVIVLRDGSWGAVEVKLGSRESIDAGASNLLKFADGLDPKMPRPEFLMVLTATDLAYVRDDGVRVVPMGCLGP